MIEIPMPTLEETKKELEDFEKILDKMDELYIDEFAYLKEHGIEQTKPHPWRTAKTIGELPSGYILLKTIVNLLEELEKFKNENYGVYPIS